MTAFALVDIAGTLFTADMVTMTFADPSTPLYITYSFPSVTLTSLTPLETLSFVSAVLNIANVDRNNQRRGRSRWKYSVYVLLNLCWLITKEL